MEKEKLYEEAAIDGKVSVLNTTALGHKGILTELLTADKKRGREN